MNTAVPPRKLLLLLLGFLLEGLPAGLCGADWPQYRGVNHDGISTDRIVKDWTGPVTNPVWRVSLTNCIGSFAVSGGRAFTQARRLTNGLDKELCVALSITDGAELWATPVDDAFYPHGGVGFDDGPRSTPSVHDGSVFVLTSYLKLYRLDATNGQVQWQQDLVSVYGGSVIPWQNAASPLLEGGRIFVNASCGIQSLMALRASDGGLIWRSQDEGMTHSTPVLATIHGVRQVIFATHSGLVSLEAESGERLWKFPYPFQYNTSIGASPVVYEDMVLVTGAQVYDMGTVVARVDRNEDTWTATQLWANISFTSTVASHWMTPVCYQGFLYGQFGNQQFDSVNARLKCVDMRTGAERWAANQFGRGGTLLVDDHIVSLTERGQLVLVKPDPNAYTELGRFTAIPNWHGNTNKCWNVPAVADGRFYVRSTSYAACFDLWIPDLKVDPPQRIASDQFRLTIRTMNGTPLPSLRAVGVEVQAATDLAPNAAAWMTLTNRLELSGEGVLQLHIDLAEGTGPRRFFRVTEPK